MAAQVEVPDGYRVVTLVGQESGGTPQIVQLDGTGRIVAVIQGEIEGITGNITVDQSSSVRQVQGIDGSTLRTVKLDANGQLIMVPRGQSGNYMSVDASGFLTSVMKGDYTGTPTTLAVDSSGNIVAVIKGNYAGALKTVATDADGRMLMIPYDPDDIWGNAIGTGNAEVIATLTPAKRYDRRGNVIFWDTFEHGLRAWAVAKTGTGADVCLSTEYVRDGSYSVRLRGGSDSSMLATIAKRTPMPALQRVGLEASWCWGDNADYIALWLYYRYNNVRYTAQVRWVNSTQDFEYYDSAGAWQDIEIGKTIGTDERDWQIMKLVIDLTTHKYVRAFLNDEEYDLSGIAYYSTALAAENTMEAAVLLISTAGNNAEAWVDSVIYTENEPA